MKNNSLISPQIAKVNLNTSHNIHCLSEKKIYWTFNGGTLPKNANDNGSGVLQLQRINWENYGVYECYGKTFSNAIEEIFYATSEVKIYCKLDTNHSEVPMIMYN